MMSLDTQSELLANIGQAMAQSAPAGWQQVSLRVTGVYSMMETALTITVADGTVDKTRSIVDEGDEACEELRAVMYEPGKGTWYNANFTLDASGKLDADFDYDEPPFEGDADEALLRDDQEKFARDSERLPAWHPARSTG